MAHEYDTNIYGPVDPSVLTDQANHRSEQVFQDGFDLLLRSRRADNKYFAEVYPKVPHRRVLTKLHQMGFYRIYKLRRFKNDLGLVTALVERWRPETNTFHFRTGEATVTLQDVAILWGLPIDGRPVVAHHHFRSFEDYASFVLELLGITIHRSDFSQGMRLKVSKLVDHVNSNHAQITNETDEYKVDQIVRCWAFMLLGVMCPDSTGEVISLLWLKMFENIDEVHTYSWGSAILAYLYRCLYNASRKDFRTVTGPLPLLQIWAWSRITVVRPTGIPREVVEDDEHGIARAPYGARWYPPVANRNTIANSLVAYRETFDHMTVHHFVWNVYNFTDVDIAELPPQCLNHDVWRASVPMVFFAIVEHHRPERVLRQFGFQQNIPRPIEQFRRVDRKGRENLNWVNEHSLSIERWNNRLQNVVDGEPGTSTQPKYDLWYDRITRRYISRDLDRLNIGYQTGSALVLQNVHREVQDLQALIQEIPRTNDATKRILESVNSSISNIIDLVTCGGSNNAKSSAGEHRELMILPQKRSHGVSEDEE